MGLEDLQQEYDYTDEPEDELEDKVREELEDMLDSMTPDQVREEIVELEDDEFQAFVEYVFGKLE